MRIGPLCAVALLLLSGCGASGRGLDVVGACTSFEGRPTPLTVAAGQIEPQLGESFTFSLCSNPSTGYSWSDDVEYDRSVVELAGRTFESGATASPPIVGAAGMDIFSFRALGTGTTAVRMTYSRPFETGQPPLWTFQVQVLVD